MEARDMSSKAIRWTDGMDAQIARLRTEGASWDVVAGVLNLARSTVIERGREIGAERPPNAARVPSIDPDRAPLTAGHPDSWNAINIGGVLSGVSYPGFVSGI
jgi:hypothetical protein